MLCTVHKGRIAIAQCAGCGKRICSECETILKAKPYCRACAKLDIPGVEYTPHRAPLIALILSFLVPGGGQVYNGQYYKGILVFMTSWLIVPWILSVYDAYATAHQINRHKIHTHPSLELSVVYLAVAVFLFWFILPQKWPSIERWIGGDRTVKRTLMKISQAAEQYREGQGRYPASSADLYFADPPYLEEDVCGQEIKGFVYLCEFSEEGYQVLASSVKNVTRKYQVTTGGELQRKNLQE